MSKSPETTAGAKVLEWAWSGDQPFDVIPFQSGEIAYEIYGLAICQYPDSDTIYRFSCDSVWEVKQDSIYDSAAEAKAQLPEQYRNVEARWTQYKFR